MTNNKSIEL